MTMTSSWLPTWVEVIAVVVYLVILVLHLWHIRTAGGLGRLWHVGHVVMALGMIDMFWPGTMPVGETGGEVIFAIAAVLSLATGVYALATGGNWRVWTVSTIDFAGMVYMFAMMSHRYEVLTIVIVVWSLAEALAWATGYAFSAFGVHEHGADLKITLAAMTLGMAYMFLAMQYGMSSMGGMTDMPGMTSMPSGSPSPSAGMTATMSPMPSMSPTS